MVKITEKVVRKGKGYKMVYVKALGNYRVYHSGKVYVFAHKREATGMVNAYRAVQSKRKARLTK